MATGPRSHIAIRNALIPGRETPIRRKNVPVSAGVIRIRLDRVAEVRKDVVNVLKQDRWIGPRSVRLARFDSALDVKVVGPRLRWNILMHIDVDTGDIQIDNAGTDLDVGWKVLFADYDYCTAEQKNWGFIADSGDTLGTDNDPAHLICP